MGLSAHGTLFVTESTSNNSSSNNIYHLEKYSLLETCISKMISFFDEIGSKKKLHIKTYSDLLLECHPLIVKRKNLKCCNNVV